MGLVVDTDVFITLERRGYRIENLSSVTLQEPVALSAVTASELLVGVERADTEDRRAKRRSFVEAALAAIPVLPFGLEVARIHARLAAGLLRTGTPIGAHDLLVAATAMQAGYGVLTINVDEFRRVPGLSVVRAPF